MVVISVLQSKVFFFNESGSRISGCTDVAEREEIQDHEWRMEGKKFAFLGDVV